MLNKDFKEFVASLNQNKVDYLVVGGYAVAIHGHPRYTKGLDIWLWVDKQNADKMMTVLTEFGFSSLELSAEDFLTKGYVIQLGQPPNRIDLLTQVDGLIVPTLCVGMQPAPLRRRGTLLERPRRYSHAERGNNKFQAE